VSGFFEWNQQFIPAGTPFNIPPPTEIDPPGEMSNHCLVWDETNNNFVLFGGLLSRFSLAPQTNTWIYDDIGLTWTNVTPIGSPTYTTSNDFYVNGCWDPGTGTVITMMYSPNEMWSWDGTVWTELFPATMPDGGRTDYVPGFITYDRGNGNVVMYGGQDVSGGALETWIWDGTDWTEVFPSAQPPVADVWDSNLMYDEAHGYVLLSTCAATGTGAGLFNETWTWDGTTWTQQAPVDSPPARSGHAMFYHIAGGTAILTQGLGVPGGGNQNFADTWAWDGTNWIDLSLPGPALAAGLTQIPHSYSQMAYDRVNDIAIMYGGFSSITFPNLYGDTWGLIWITVTPPTTTFIPQIYHRRKLTYTRSRISP
jgi:hypothetical protein